MVGNCPNIRAHPIKNVAVGILAAVLLANSVAAAEKGLFSSTERFVRDTSRHTKWTGMLTRLQSEWDVSKNTVAGNVDALGSDLSDGDKARATRLIDCGLLDKGSCRRGVWDDFLKESEKLSGLAQLDAVNRFHNQTPYITDIVNWRVADYWETLGEYFLKDGDCEDYAISKYISLKRLGWPPEFMRIVVIQDENLRIPHAVLVVYVDDKRYVLDNQAPAILTDDRILHYRPVFSINETGWWHHIPRRFLSRFR